MAESPTALLREMRQATGLSQRGLARLAGTSQPAIARYEGESATPSWETMLRLAKACGRQLRVSAEPLPDPHDVELAEHLIALSPAERLGALRRYARLRRLASEGR
jgi:transcriptional regulator with XRE-family HTH domain